jgi:zinc protease
VFATLAAASTLSAQEDRHHQALHRFTLDNGLEIMVVQNHAAPIATVLVAVRGGANVQVPGEEGLAHLFEHLVFRSYGGGPTAFYAAVGDLNGTTQGITEFESVYYYLILPSGNTQKGIRLLGRLITRAEFSRGDLEDERKIVLDELERRESDPEEALERGLSQRLWGAAWHRRDRGGDSLSLMGITQDRLTDAYARYYVPNNATLIVTGDVVAGEVFHAAQRHFGDWRRGADPFEGTRLDPIVPLTSSQALIVSRAVPDVTIRIAVHGPNLRDDTAASYAAHALLEIINDPSSAFQERLVESGLFQWVESSYAMLSDVGPITILGKTTAAAAHNALPALLVQVDSLALLVGVTDQDLATAKRRREVDAALALEAAAVLAPSLASWWAGAGMDYYFTYHERMNALTLDDLRQFAHQYLVERPKVIGMLGPSATMAPMADWLRGISREP